MNTETWSCCDCIISFALLHLFALYPNLPSVAIFGSNNLRNEIGYTALVRRTDHIYSRKRSSRYSWRGKPLILGLEFNNCVYLNLLIRWWYKLLPAVCATLICT